MTRRLQRILLRLQQYDLLIKYKKGSELHIADTLLRAYLSDGDDQDRRPEVLMFHEELNFIDIVRRPNFRRDIGSDTGTDRLRCKPAKAGRYIVRKGWPNNKEQVSQKVKPFFSMRDEITIHEGILFRGNRVIISSEMQAKIIPKIHAFHIRVNGCLRWACECVYRPSMGSRIRQYVSQCEIYRSLETSS